MPSCLVFVASPSLAQVSSNEDLSVTAVFGWGGLMPAERWAPITVEVTAGERPASGVVIVEYPQDSTQWARITAPFAATPNRTTPVTIVAALRERCDELRITLVTDDRRVRRLRFTPSGANNTIRMPSPLGPSQGVILSVGRATLPECAREWPLFAGGQVREDEPAVLEPSWGQLSVARADPNGLPPVAAAYDSLAALVVPGDAGTGVDPRAIEAVHEWVLGGGRLLIVADQPGEAWRAWLPAPVRGLIVSEDPSPRPVPPEVASAIRTFAADLASPAKAIDRIRDAQKERAKNSPYGPPAPHGQGAEKPSATKLPEPAAAATSRLFRLSGAARELGWTVRWRPEGAADAGALAEGPAGFGHIAVLGLEPMRATETVSTRAAGAAWRDAIAPAIDDFLRSADWAGQPAWYGSQWPPQRAINAALETMSNVPGIGGWLLLAFGAGLLVLVVMVGPVDFLMLRRLKAGQHWWLSSLGWVGLASAAAWAAPGLIRTHPTRVATMSVVDQVCAAAPGAPASPAEPLARATALVSVYAGESGVISPRTEPASWWRGVSAVQYWHGEVGGRGDAPTHQGAAGGAAGSRRGNALRPFSMPLWTFRSFLEQSRPEPSLSARVRITEGGECRAFIVGLAEGCEVVAAEVRVGEQRFAARGAKGTPGRAPQRQHPHVAPAERFEFPAGAVGAVSGGAWEATLPVRRADGALWEGTPARQHQPWVTPVFHPGAAFDLAGPDRRTQAVSRLAETGRFAVLYALVRGCPAHPAIDRPSEHDHTRILRLIVPLERAPGSTDDPGEPPAGSPATASPTTPAAPA